MKVAGAQPGNFRGRADFLEWGHFHKHFMCDIQKKRRALQGNIFRVFFQDTLKTTFKLKT